MIRIWTIAILSTAGLASAQTLAKTVFDAQCARCHGIGGTGGEGPSLAVPVLRHAGDDEALASVIENGIENTDNAAHRFSPLDQVNRQNVASLVPKWIYQTQGGGSLETSPIVVDGVMYLTKPPATVVALDVHTGRELWSWTRPMPSDLLTLGFPRTNRGLAILGETVYVGTLDSHVVALDASSGAVRWDETIADNHLGYSITAAPLAIQDKIIVGISGGEAGVRGFLDAYDAATGEREWRTYTVPGPGESGHDTWGGDSWKTGGAATWLTGAYDPETNVLYWGTGNPAPDWNGDDRPGDNLYSCSLLAIDAD